MGVTQNSYIPRAWYIAYRLGEPRHGYIQGPRPLTQPKSRFSNLASQHSS